MNKETIERIMRTYNICKTKKSSKNIFKGKRLEQIKSVNNVYKEIVDLENFINIKNIRYKVIIDTGSGFNFVAESLVSKLRLKVKTLDKKIDFFTCLKERYFVTKQVEIRFQCDGKNYKEKFYILPRRRDEAILLGRFWINKKNEIKRDIL